MVSIPWQVRLGALLVCCSACVYTTKLLVIDNLSGTIEYVFNSFGFLFINIMVVTLVINELLSIRARNNRLDKLNMVIGTFFSEVGTDMLCRILPADQHHDDIRKGMALSGNDRPDLKVMLKNADAHHFIVQPDLIDFSALYLFLSEKRDFLLRLLENPVMLEHQTFTRLLQASFHLTEELSRRSDLNNLNLPDQRHLAGDVSRVYSLLTREWIRYMGYLHREYPYLYSLAVRTNPFDPEADVIVQE